MILNIDLTNIFLFSIAIFVIIRFSPIIIYFIKHKYLKYLLNNQRDIKKYIEGINKDLRKSKIASEIGDQLLLHKVGALIMDGDFDKAIENIHIINQTKLSRRDRLIYIYYKTRILFEIQRKKEAQVELEKYKKELLKAKKPDKYRIPNNKLIAIEFYHNNEFEKSKDILEKTLKMKLGKFSKSEINYYLALISIKTNKIKNAKEFLSMAKKFGEKTYIEKKSLEILKEIKS